MIIVMCDNCTEPISKGEHQHYEWESETTLCCICYMDCEDN